MTDALTISSVAALGTRPKLNLQNVEEKDFYRELAKTAKEIQQLKDAFDVVNANQEAFAADRIALRLTAAEQEFFLIFNNLRQTKGYEPLKGKRFTGNFSYESYLFFDQR